MGSNLLKKLHIKFFCMFCKLTALLEYLDLLQNIYIKNCALFLHTKFAISYYIFILYFYIISYYIFNNHSSKNVHAIHKNTHKNLYEYVPHTEIFQGAFYLCILEMICPK